MERRGRIEPTRLLTRYILALALIIVFVLGGHGLHIITGKQGALDEEVLNISGRQRMLSQRIVLLAHRKNETTSSIYRDLLVASVDQFERSHQWIMNNAVVAGTDIDRYYNNPMGADLDRRSRAFVGFVRELLDQKPGSPEAVQASKQLEEMALVSLLADLNTAVGLFEAAANERAERLEHIQIAAVVATLLVLLLEVLLIFYPAHQSMLRMIHRLRHQAWHDQMTGLANRTRFVARAKELIDQRPGKLDKLIFFALDLDGFKQINDTLGHPVGDQVLKRVARVIETQLSIEPRLGEYIVARVGGDEFLICAYLPEAGLTTFANEIGDALIAAVEEPIPVTLGDGRPSQCLVGVSIGYSLGGGTFGELETILGNADIALYVSKRRGKGVTTAFEHSMRESAERRHTLLTEVKAGLKNLEFEPHFQPQISLTTGQLAGVEAVARWNHPSRGLVGPDHFMSLTEETRLVDALDGQIILAALQAYQELKSGGIELGKLSLNASSSTLRDPDFCDLLFNIADAHGVSPASITVEILENIVLNDGDDEAVLTVNRLSKAGFAIAIDDFGVGFSSLSRVSSLDVSAIKIDRSLTMQVGTESMDKILAATAAMANGLNVTLLAEGIETEKQRVAMKALGVEVGQGFLWARPMALPDLQTWIRSEQFRTLRAV